MAVSVRGIARIELNAADPERLAAFYEGGFGFVRQGEATMRGEALARLFGTCVEQARVVALRLGEQVIHLVGLTPQDASYPGDVPGPSPLFQHFAMIVPDMEAAYDQLSRVSGWHTISRDGPQRLPPSSGGVTAFKFRDPEGHPLELLAFPEGGVPEIWRRPSAKTLCLGIDHSAISVADTGRSVRFYQGLGFRVISRSHNVGFEQARLDGVEAPDVEVTGLGLPGEAAPHLELLCYRSQQDRTRPPLQATDAAAARLVLTVTDEAALARICEALPAHLVSPEPVAWPDGRVEALMRDPDGHHLLLTTGA